jgi:hypothetical protein
MDRKTLEFIECAKKYCEIIEGRDRVKPQLFLREVAKVLARLYALAMELPEVEIESENLLEKGISEPQWNKLFGDLGQYLGKDDYYVQMFDPTDIEEERPVGSSLADDLADIYRDLLTGLANIEKSPINDLIWEWKFNFKVHWGNHLTSALSAIHHVIYKDDL